MKLPKIHILFVLICAISSLGALVEGIKLTNSVLSMVDGSVLNGSVLFDMKYLDHLGREIQFGRYNSKTGKKEGLYEYKGKKFSLHQLATIESKINAWRSAQIQELDNDYLNRQLFENEWHKRHEVLEIERDRNRLTAEEELGRSLHSYDILDRESSLVRSKIRQDYYRKCKATQTKIKRECIKNLSEYEQQLHKVETIYQEQIAPLRSCLTEAKKHYVEINEPYIEHAQGAKELIFKLVQDSCIKRKRYDSKLFEWGAVPDGQELKFFHLTFDENQKGEFTMLEEFDEFMTDLSNFFADLMASCDKARAQYQRLVESLQKDK